MNLTSPFQAFIEPLVWLNNYSYKSCVGEYMEPGVFWKRCNVFKISPKLLSLLSRRPINYEIAAPCCQVTRSLISIDLDTVKCFKVTFSPVCLNESGFFVIYCGVKDKVCFLGEVMMGGIRVIRSEDVRCEGCQGSITDPEHFIYGPLLPPTQEK